VPGVAREIKKTIFEDEKIQFLAYVTPGVLKGSLEKCSLFGLAVWPAITDIFINKYTYI